MKCIVKVKKTDSILNSKHQYDKFGGNEAEKIQNMKFGYIWSFTCMYTHTFICKEMQ